MSQLKLSAIGDIDKDITLVTDPDLTVGADQVLVAIEAAVINPVDLMIAAGTYGFQAKPPFALGTEGVGRVTAAGASVDQALVGRRVIILPNYQQGTWADEVVVAASNVVPVTDEGDPAQLALVATNPLTAHLLLTRYVDLQPGDWIGQNLGSSTVGQYVLGLAKRAGLKVLSVVRSEEAADRLRRQGAGLVVVDGNDLAERIKAELGGQQLKLVLDGAGDATVGALASALEFEGTLVSYSSVTGQPVPVGLGDSIYRQLKLRGIWIVNWLQNSTPEEIATTYGELAELVAQGVLSAEVEASYPVAGYREALDHARRPGRTGKIVFTP